MHCRLRWGVEEAAVLSSTRNPGSDSRPSASHHTTQGAEPARLEPALPWEPPLQLQGRPRGPRCRGGISGCPCPAPGSPGHRPGRASCMEMSGQRAVTTACTVLVRVASRTAAREPEVCKECFFSTSLSVADVCQTGRFRGHRCLSGR